MIPTRELVEDDDGRHVVSPKLDLTARCAERNCSFMMVILMKYFDRLHVLLNCHCCVDPHKELYLRVVVGESIDFCCTKRS